MHRVLINNLSEPDEFTVVDDNYRPVSGEIDLNDESDPVMIVEVMIVEDTDGDVWIQTL